MYTDDHPCIYFGFAKRHHHADSCPEEIRLFGIDLIGKGLA